jgi:hypothetical protein
MFKSGWIWFIALLVGVIIFWPKTAPAPAVITGKTVVRDTLVVHDTVRVAKSKSEIGVSRIVVHDTIQTHADPTKTDSATSYSVEQHFERGAYVRASLSSKEFQVDPPADLKGFITYLPPIDSIKIISRTDTIPKFVFKPPAIPTWQAVTLGIAAGVLAGLLVKK